MLPITSQLVIYTNYMQKSMRLRLLVVDLSIKMDDNYDRSDRNEYT